MLRSFLPVLITCTVCLPSFAQNEETRLLHTDAFVFEVNGNKLSGLLDSPTLHEPVATIIIVHGYGKTNVVEQNWYYSLRSQFAEIGINTLMWDKPGCGKSEGEFDIDQPVQSSAKEVVAAVQALKDQQIKGTENIGLWGISRAGWIAPLALQEEEDIAFWISVSGTDDKENARYLIESNLRAEGQPEEYIELIVSEWQANFNTGWKKSTYEQYLNATPNYQKDEFIQYMGWTGLASEEEFLDYQNKFATGELTVDEHDELLIYVPDFRELLKSIDKPVLALFGEKDTNVDWRKTAALYKETMGTNPDASLTVITFPDGNHTLRQSETGAIREMLNQDGNTPYAEGYYESMRDWLIANGFGVALN